MIARIELADLVRIERLEDSVRTGRRLLVLVLVNALVCVLAYVLLGGSAFLCKSVFILSQFVLVRCLASL